MRGYSDHLRESTAATSGEEPAYLLEITHDQLDDPLRVVNDTQDLTSNGDTYTGYPFRISLPTDVDRELPRAVLTIDNTGRELTQWLDNSNGGQGAQVRVMQIMRDDPDTIEFEITLDLLNVSQSPLEIRAELGYDDTLNLAGLPITHRPDISPGLF